MKHSLKEYISTHPWINLFENPNPSDSSHPIIPHAYLFKTKEEAEKIGKDFPHYLKTIKIEWEE